MNEPIPVCLDIDVTAGIPLDGAAFVEMEYTYSGCGLPLRIHTTEGTEVNEWFLKRAIEIGLVHEVVYDQHIPAS